MGFPSVLPDILNNLLMFPPEPIKEIFLKLLVFFLIHFSTSAKTSLSLAQKANNMDYVKLNTDSLKEWGVKM